MDITSIGLTIIIIGILGAVLVRILRKSHDQTIIPFESLYDNERLEQLINIAGGDSIAQLVRLYNIRGTDLAFANQKNSFDVRSLTRDRIILFQEINRLRQLRLEKESQLLSHYTKVARVHRPERFL
ncbi:MAG: hypothetical protein ABSA44_09745 [Bacteroidota bacterium]|jgi:hypothetical protein